MSCNILKKITFGLMNLDRLLIIVFFGLLTTTIYDAGAHQLFNSADERIGNYRIQIATLPEIPTVNEKSQILFRVLDSDDKEVDKFRMGIRIYYDDLLVDTLPPQYHENGHWETDYVFHEPGNHIFRVDLYDVRENGNVLTYTFNISTLNPFGFIFYYTVISGGIAGIGIMIWAILSKKKARAKL